MNVIAVALMLFTGSLDLQTIAEKSGWTRTGRYDETIDLCHRFQRAFPRKARCEQFGVTPEGRPLLALSASADGALTPQSARTKKREVILLQGGIHAGEIDGKDAGFWLMRDVLSGHLLAGVLSKVTVVFVPVFNVDGHERFGPHNRPNQRGPEEMGWRTTAQNLNLNRDYTKAEAPEMVAMLRLLNRWDPIAYVDLHVTDGAKFQHDVSVLMEPTLTGPDSLQSKVLASRKAVFDELLSKQHLPVDFYPSFVKDDDPSSGFARGVSPARFSTGYWVLRNRIGVLVETHSWKDYATRVKATRDVVEAILRQAKDHASEWRAAAKTADEQDRAGPQSPVSLAYEPTGKPVSFDFQGYEYVRELSDVSGKRWTRYDESRPSVWRIPLVQDVKATLTARPPRAGYLIPAAYAGWLGEKLKLHGFLFHKVARAVPSMGLEAFRAAEVRFHTKSFEGHVPVDVKGNWAHEKRAIPSGSLFVPIAQPGRALLVQLLEPTAPDSFVSWGFFDTSFETKEGMDNHVAEAEARHMLAADAALKAEFQNKLASDPTFAADSAARLNFFTKRHPSADDRLNLYPVYRLDQSPLPPGED